MTECFVESKVSICILLPKLNQQAYIQLYNVKYILNGGGGYQRAEAEVEMIMIHPSYSCPGTSYK